ncbi:shikimate kinase [Jatrophihabitans sp. YIM 134969]
MSAIVVLGLMGAGKSTLAHALGDRLGRPVRDSDEDIERDEGRTAAEIAAADGRDALHDIEARVLLDALADPTVVVAAAASVVDRAETRAALATPFVVWVDAPVEVLRARFESRAHRPRYEQDVGHMLRAQLASRGPWLEQLADLRVDATRPVGDLVDEVVAALPG